MNNKVRALDTRRKVAPSLDTPTDLSDEAVRELSAKLNEILADVSRSILRPRISIGMSVARISAIII